MTSYKNFILALLTVAVLAGVLGIGYQIGYNQQPASSSVACLSNKSDIIDTMTDFSPFWKEWSILNDKYIYSASTTDQKKVWGAMQGLASSYGDPYTAFFPPSDAKVFKEDVKGSFEGIGLEIGTKQNMLTAVAPLKGSPSEKAGVKPGDKIYKIDGKSSLDMNPDDAVKLIRGKDGTTVKLTVIREGAKQPIDISIIRKPIDVPTIETTARKDGVFVIRLYSFTETSPNLFRNALRDFVSSGDSKLILDLRGNPGGYLESAVSMASWFLPAGDVVVSEDFGGKFPQNVHRSLGYDIFNKNLKFVILIDGGSASASEILSGALHDHKIAKLVGAQSFGKGCVQEMVPVTEDTFLKVTVALWKTPNGTSISDKGITPDYVVKVTQAAVDKGIDEQMNKAVEVLNTWK